MAKANNNLEFRRSVLKKSAILSMGTMGLAGCLGDDDDDVQDDADDSDTDDTDTDDTDTDDSDEEITIRITHLLSPEHVIIQENLNPWMDQVKELSDSTVEFEVFPNQEIVTYGEEISAINGGVAEMGFIAPSETDALQLSEVALLPNLFPNGEVGNIALWDFTENYLADAEFRDFDIEPILTSMNEPYQLFTMDSEVSSLSDWEGLNCRSAGGIMSSTINTLGGNPVEMPGTEAYTALERGTIDGTITPPSHKLNYDLQEFEGYLSTNANYAGWGGIWGIDADLFNDLPQDVQDAMKTAGQEVSYETGRSYDEADEAAIETFEELGNVTYELTDDALDDIDEELEPLQDEWVESGDDEALFQETLDEWLSTLSDAEGRT